MLPSYQAPGTSAHPHFRKHRLQILRNMQEQHYPRLRMGVLCNLSASYPFFLCFSLTCVYSYVPNKLAGLFKSLSAVVAAVCEPTAVNVFLVVSGTRGERPVEEVNTRNVNFVLGQADLFV